MQRTQWLIIANGDPLEKDKIKALTENKSIIALDGALTQCLECDIIPDIVIGDFDSLDIDLVETFKDHHHITFIKNNCQNTTDLDKALSYLFKINAEDITIAHATGRRLDHSLYNLRLLKKFHETFKYLKVITSREKAYFLKDQNCKLSGPINQAVALLSFPKAIINSVGLKYDMQDYELNFSFNESTSNSLGKTIASIEVQGEALLLISHEIELQLRS